jgi:hypothetical protein
MGFLGNALRNNGVFLGIPFVRLQIQKRALNAAIWGQCVSQWEQYEIGISTRATCLEGPD